LQLSTDVLITGDTPDNGRLLHAVFSPSHFLPGPTAVHELPDFDTGFGRCFLLDPDISSTRLVFLQNVSASMVRTIPLPVINKSATAFYDYDFINILF
jgi:hypothetical protein